jgi:hypothetical protein
VSDVIAAALLGTCHHVTPGVIPGVNLASQDLAVLYKMRDLTRLANDASWEWLEKGVKGGGSAAWAKCWDGPQHVVFGHDAKRGLQVRLSMRCGGIGGK